MKQDPIRSPYLSLAPGDALPLERARGPFGADMPPAWYAVTCGRQRHDMIGASAWLVREGGTEVWFPQETTRRTIRRGHRVFREKVTLPIVPGLLFLRTARSPQWDVIADRRRLRPLVLAGRPVQIADHVLAGIEGLPDRIVALSRAAAAAAAAAEAATRPAPGQPARIVAGPFSGRLVEVETVDGTEAVVILDGLRLRTTTRALRRKA